MRTLLTLIAPLVLAACSVTSTPTYDTSFGNAVRDARERQALNAGKPVNTVPPDGLEGKAAHDAMLLYQKTFQSPPPVVNVINIGGQTGSGSR
jgi:hypothetical protein